MSEALRLADAMTHYFDERGPDAEEVAAELRRLHQSEREGWRYADELEQERKRLHALNAELVEALQLVLNNNECLLGERVARAAMAKVEESK